MNTNLKQVWKCGGGTQSCAIGALIIQGILPKPDVSIIADTGREAESTWRYLDNVLSPALSSVGINIERIKATEFGYGGNDLFSATGELLIPVYSSQTAGATSKLSAFCNRWWKMDALKVVLSKRHGLTRSKYRSWIGYSFDEQRRWSRMMDSEEYQKGLIWFPLVDSGIRRQQGIQIVKDMGWPEPPRSRCWMCPNQSDGEWRQLRDESPNEFARAIETDHELRLRDPHAWLHRSCKPLSQVDFDEPEDLFSRACDSGSCFT